MRCVLSGTPDRLWGVLSVCGVPVKIWAFGVWLQGQRLELCCRWWCTSLATYSIRPALATCITGACATGGCWLGVVDGEWRVGTSVADWFTSV